MIKRLFLTAIAVLLASPALATVHIHNITIDASSISDFGTSVAPDGSTRRVQFVPPPLIAPASITMTLNVGDTIETNVTITGGGLTLESGGAGSLELLRFGWNDPSFNPNVLNPDLLPAVTYDRTNELTVNSFSGSLNATPTYSETFSSPALFFNQFYFGNITDSVVTLTSFTMRTTFHSIIIESPFDNDYATPIDVTSNSFFAIDQAYPAPAPGALVLLGVGLLGLAVRRRPS